ncbi:MAG: hypothetical protein EPN48_11335 [Microbacteriaceae bacterium]|nr:MAG: hypothetical protein EPN48_11335 [Microbacteriaceae bacterium]
MTLAALVGLEGVQGRGSYYFPGRFGGHLQSSTVYRWVTERTPGWTLHSLRHRAATIGYSRTQDLRATQELLGHASPATTQIYTAVSFADIQAVVRAASLNFPVREDEGIGSPE